MLYRIQGERIDGRLVFVQSVKAESIGKIRHFDRVIVTAGKDQRRIAVQLTDPDRPLVDSFDVDLSQSSVQIFQGDQIASASDGDDRGRGQTEEMSDTAEMLVEEDERFRSRVAGEQFDLSVRTAEKTSVLVEHRRTPNMARRALVVKEKTAGLRIPHADRTVGIRGAEHSATLVETDRLDQQVTMRRNENRRDDGMFTFHVGQASLLMRRTGRGGEETEVDQTEECQTRENEKEKFPQGARESNVDQRMTCRR